MEVGGFRIRLDLSQFFSDIKKFSCIYVDLSRDRQIADVVDRISELFGIERPLFLLDEKFYLPESENVNALRDSKVVKVLKAFHFQDKQSCSTADHLTKRSKGEEYLRGEIFSEQIPIKNNRSDISENFGSHDTYQNEKDDSCPVSLADKAAFHELRGKKRKHKVFDESRCTNSVNILQQDLEPEIHYQKKCKRKKERVKKEVLNGSSLELHEDEIEEKISDGIHFDSKSKKKKNRNKADQINGDITEEKVVSEALKQNSLENISDHTEQTTYELRGLKEHRKKRKEDLVSLDAYKIFDSEPVHSTDLKKHKKKVRQTDPETDVAQDQRSLSCEKMDTTFLNSCSQGTQECKNESTSMYQNIDGLVNSGVENGNNTDSDFAHRVVSSTPTFTDGCMSTEMADFLLQDTTNIYDSTLVNHLDSVTNTAISTKPKRRRRIRVRKHRKRNGILNNSIVALSSMVPQLAVLRSSITPRKHIRFEEGMNENLKEITSHKELPLNNDLDLRNNATDEICDSKASPNVNDECTYEPTPGTEVTDCPMKNSFEYSMPENLRTKNDTTTSPNQIPLHQQWALNTTNLNMDSKESLQKLLILGKQNSVPVVFERKSQCNNSRSSSESVAPVSKQNDDKSAEGTCDFQSTTKVVALADRTYLKTNPNAIDPLHYPQLQGKPKLNDIIAFKVLKMNSNYTPEVSGFIIATVQDICEDTCEMSLQIEVGESDLEVPKGKFSLENEDSEKIDNDSKLHQLNWNELMDVRILFP